MISYRVKLRKQNSIPEPHATTTEPTVLAWISVPPCWLLGNNDRLSGSVCLRWFILQLITGVQKLKQTTIYLEMLRSPAIY
jgi:hypothetical protein